MVFGVSLILSPLQLIKKQRHVIFLKNRNQSICNLYKPHNTYLTFRSDVFFTTKAKYCGVTEIYPYFVVISSLPLYLISFCTI